jgi:hypothetical protein
MKMFGESVYCRCLVSLRDTVVGNLEPKVLVRCTVYFNRSKSVQNLICSLNFVQ